MCIWASSSCLAVMNLKSNSRHGKSLVLRGVGRKLVTHLPPASAACLVFTRSTWVTFNMTFPESNPESMIHCVLCLGGSKVQGEVKNSATVEWIGAPNLDLNPFFVLSKCWFGFWTGWICLSDAGSLLNIPVGKTHGWFKPLGSENSSRYQKSRGGTVTLALQPLTSSRVWDLNQLLRSLNLSTRDLEVKSRKKKSSDFPRLC